METLKIKIPKGFEVESFDTATGELKFKEEGEELNHCVFASSYYTKQDSLIFSARLKGKRIATIEIDTKSLKILQVRGYNNQDSSYDKRIRKLIKNNLESIHSRLIKQKQVA